MKTMKHLLLTLCLTALAALLNTGCQSDKSSACCQPATTTAAAPAPAPAAAPLTPAVAPAMEKKIIRIKAGVSSPVTDSAGNVWLADQGFEGGETVERAEAEITGTKDQVIYRAERFSMEGFSWPLANGKYQVKLHFCETFEGITGPGERVFTFTVQGQEFKDFDVIKKAGGALKAYVETVNVEVTDGKLHIKFTSNIENPEINGIEIIPVG